ncbi:LOB domain-containing protein 22 [Hibiscus syriacus]|uniref:LOB domain-containing protein 22 n=1 Tax=Hibiscus syriacus TaxID=106335 RepID=A0A6A2ZT92_HIBSY|nr:LOB domain-containing protein 27-like [Hibiscus syriacus]KAE8695070.1 LOB domain-containing protein 22 [Hibiscus syriacus]
MTLKGGATSACAACKYQRRKCIPECLLAPHFPADQTKVFQNAHKLFGVSNIVKILRSLDPSQHAEAMRSIKYQANVRDRFPVYGCLGVIRQLYYQIQLVEEEFHAVLTQLEMCRQQQQRHQISSMADYVISQLELDMVPPTNALPVFNQPYSMYKDSPKENNSLWIQHLFLDTNNHSNDSPVAIQSQLVDAQHEVVRDYDEIRPFIDDEQSYVDSKDNYDSAS